MPFSACLSTHSFSQEPGAVRANPFSRFKKWTQSNLKCEKS
jgi:hypothetical protein